MTYPVYRSDGGAECLIRLVKRVNRESTLIGIVLLIALCLRVWGISYDLPYVYHPDEPGYVTISQNIFKTGDLNPHFFNYPSLFFYINSLAYIPYYLVGKLAGVFHARQDILAPISLAMGVTRSPMPITLLLGRAITVMFGVGSVGLTFCIGRQLVSPAVGILAALTMAVSPGNVAHSRLVTPDTFVTFFAAATFLAAVSVYRHGNTWHYLAAGLSAGLTASSKYNGGLIVLSLLLASFLRRGKAMLAERNLYLALLLCGLGFLATTPFALIDFSKFMADLRFEVQHYSTGHAGMEGNALGWYLEYMWQTGGVIYILAALEILRGIYARSKDIILLSIFPLAYFVLIASFVVRNSRTFLPLTPFLFLLAASFLAHVSSRAKGLHSKAWRNVSISAIAGLAVAGLLLPISKTVTDTIRLTTINSRETARVWIADNLPPGAKIAIESYAPFIEPAHFGQGRVHGFGRMTDHTPEWYIENGFEYLVFSQGIYGRFYHEPERYSTEVSQYNSFFNRFTLIKMFVDGNYEVRVYKVE